MQSLCPSHTHTRREKVHIRYFLFQPHFHVYCWSNYNESTHVRRRSRLMLIKWRPTMAHTNVAQCTILAIKWILWNAISCSAYIAQAFSSSLSNSAMVTKEFIVWKRGGKSLSFGGPNFFYICVQSQLNSEEKRRQRTEKYLCTVLCKMKERR